MCTSIFINLFTISSLHDSRFKLILLFAEMGWDEMSTSISYLHKCGAFLVRRSIDHPIWIQTHFTSQLHTHCCFLSASFYPGPSSQEPPSRAQCSVLLCSQHTLYIFRAPCLASVVYVVQTLPPSSQFPILTFYLLLSNGEKGGRGNLCLKIWKTTFYPNNIICQYVSGVSFGLQV